MLHGALGKAERWEAPHLDLSSLRLVMWQERGPRGPVPPSVTPGHFMEDAVVYDDAQNRSLLSKMCLSDARGLAHPPPALLSANGGDTHCVLFIKLLLISGENRPMVAGVWLLIGCAGRMFNQVFREMSRVWEK